MLEYEGGEEPAEKPVELAEAQGRGMQGGLTRQHVLPDAHEER